MKTSESKVLLAISMGIFSLLLFSACSIFEPDDKIYYHKVGAEGYVYYQDKPVPDAEVIVENRFKSQTLAVKPSINERFTTDETGYFYARFIRRTDHQDVRSYRITFSGDTIPYEEIYIYPKDINNSKTNIQLGIINLSKN